MLRRLRGWALNGIDLESDMDSESDAESESDSESSIVAMDGPADPETNILWLYGPAGAGKSAIMQTLASQLRDAGRLGGSFFFKRGHATRGNAKTLFATIAYQLALAVPCLRTSISQVVEDDPSVIVRSIAVQIKKLISDPCRSHVHENCDPVIILIDGLDECEGLDIQVEILRIIRHSSSQGPNPLRFIIASRPEAHIYEMFDSPIYVGHHCPVNLQSFDDVREYLRDEFSRIHCEHYSMKSVLFPWPSPDVLEKLVKNSSGYFIYASTIIKFIDDKNYRPTERLAVVQDPTRSGSESAFNTLDQLYMTILSSAPRQSQLIPILCAIIHMELVAGEIDQLLGLAEGDTLLLLRGLRSVLAMPSEETAISFHHASFGDFLNHPDRSGIFCVGTLNRQICLALSLLQYHAGPFQRRRISILSKMIRFIVSLRPSDALAELFPLIGSTNPDYIFTPKNCQLDNYLGAMILWLKNNPSAPADVIQLWEDYAFMCSIDNMRSSAKAPSVEYNVSPSPELVRILVITGFLRRQLWELPINFDLTWTDLRTTLCSLRSNFSGNEHALPVPQPLIAFPWAARDLALQCIRKIVKNHINTDSGVNPSASHDAVLYNDNWNTRNLESAYAQLQYALGCDLSYLVRLSPPCPVLYRELWLIPPLAIWSSWPSGDYLIHNVSKWLESFPDSTMELVAFWQQAASEEDRRRINRWSLGPGGEESDWGYRLRHYNNMLAASTNLDVDYSLIPVPVNYANYCNYQVKLA
ncbi:putative nwd2 protein [Mycena sanguinolenta]|uniref:Putative nwd2 protein n=1 Tax=Mycena sanguinolenta TaxID=230812 RepID=A0A8H6X5I4_9AGAR|nr:putative nwd2 protein [Mycena sanguinolenta]